MFAVPLASLTLGLILGPDIVRWLADLLLPTETTEVVFAAAWIPWICRLLVGGLAGYLGWRWR